MDWRKGAANRDVCSEGCVCQVIRAPCCREFLFCKFHDEGRYVVSGVRKENGVDYTLLPFFFFFSGDIFFACLSMFFVRPEGRMGYVTFFIPPSPEISASIVRVSYHVNIDKRKKRFKIAVDLKN